jgi:hypothetical protein
MSKNSGEALPPDTTYQALLGYLLYLSVNTRPDISHALGNLSRFMSCATSQHWENAKHVLRYSKGKEHLGLRFSGRSTSNQGVPSLNMYSDADFATDVGKRRSTTGAVMLMNGEAVLWTSMLNVNQVVFNAVHSGSAVQQVDLEALQVSPIPWFKGHCPQMTVCTGLIYYSCFARSHNNSTAQCFQYTFNRLWAQHRTPLALSRRCLK